MSVKLLPERGLVFGVKLDSGLSVLGVYERVGRDGIHLGAFFPVEYTSALSEGLELSPKNVLFRGKFGDDYLHQGKWLCDGSLITLSFEEWPEPGFVLGSRTGVSYYNDNWELIRFDRIAVEPNGTTLIEDVFSPSRALELKLGVRYQDWRFKNGLMDPDEEAAHREVLKKRLPEKVTIPWKEFDEVKAAVAAVLEGGGLALVAQFIAAATADPEANLDAKAGAAAWVACELVAAWYRKSTSDLGNCPDIRTWADQGIRSGIKMDRDLVNAARLAQERVESDESAFARLWREVDDQRFQWAMNSLRRRLAPKSKPKVKASKEPKASPIIVAWKEFDDVQDWVGDFVEGRDLTLAEQLIAAVNGDSDGYLDLKAGAGGWVACELVAAWYQKSTSDLTMCPEIREWADQGIQSGVKLGRQLVSAARLALERVSGDESEFAELWRDADSEGFQAAMSSLRRRLGPKGKVKT